MWKQYQCWRPGRRSPSLTPACTMWTSTNEPAREWEHTWSIVSQPNRTGGKPSWPLWYMVQEPHVTKFNQDELVDLQLTADAWASPAEISQPWPKSLESPCYPLTYEQWYIIIVFTYCVFLIATKLWGCLECGDNLYKHYCLHHQYPSLIF